MRINRLNKIEKSTLDVIVISTMIGGYFLAVFLLTPITMDRYYESFFDIEVQSAWRYILMQSVWVSSANLRILSNVFSMMIDGNFYISAFCNAVMMSIIVGYSVNKSENRFFAMFVFLASYIMIGNTYWSEVFWCAKTLYLSSLLVTLFFIEWLIGLEGEISIRRATEWFVVGVLWHEIVIVAMFAASAAVLVFKTAERKSKAKEAIVCFVAFLLVLFDYVHTRMNASFRMNDVNSALTWTGKEIFEENIFIFVLLTITLLSIYRKEANNKWWMFSICILNSITTCALIFRKVYCDYIQVYSEKIYTLEKINNAIYKICSKYYLLLLIITNVVALCERAIKKRDKRAVIISLVILVECSMGILVFPNMARVQTIWILLFPFMCVLSFDYSRTKMKPAIEAIIGVTTLVVFVRSISIILFISSMKDIETRNVEVANQVYEQQVLSRWNYDDEVVFLRYRDAEDGKKIWTDSIYENKDTHQYRSVLAHYRLNEKTKVEYKDTYSY